MNRSGGVLAGPPEHPRRGARAPESGRDRETVSDGATDADILEHIGFRMTGRISGGSLDRVGAPDLRPALLAGYLEPSKLRHDYPVVLVEGGPDEPFVYSLSDVVDDILREIAPRGIKGERLRKHVLRLEAEMRALASRGARISLSRLWRLARKNLLSSSDGAEKKSLKDSLRNASDALRVDGPVIDCGDETPTALVRHAWSAVHDDKARKCRDRIDELILKLSDILKADYMKSEAARAPERLKGAVGIAYESVFDFDAMSRILAESPAGNPLPEKRRRRIRAALAILQSQRFVAPPRRRAPDADRDRPYAFVFDRCARALEAFQDRLPAMVELVKAMSVADLEIENRYQDSTHDPFFAGFDESALAPEDLAFFPSYLVCPRGRRHEAAETAKLVEILSSGLPIKVLVQTDDILGDPPAGVGQFSFGVKGPRLAAMAVGLNAVYVLQSSGSNLYRMRDRIMAGLKYSGPALLSVFSGSTGTTAGLPPYLSAAAALQSRAFPAFAYDPAAGGDWASRFEVGDNPQAEADWPVRRLSYEDEEHRRISENVTFTFVDFVACDERYAGHFARVPRSKWHDGMMPVSAYLELETEAPPEWVPYVLMVDGDDILHRVIVEDKLIEAARRCRETWRGLRELGGIDNSHARRLLASEREIWERDKQREIEELKERVGQAAAPEAPEAAEAPAPRPDEAEPEAPPADEPHIETARCTTCNECTEINDKMFVYDDNKQAYIADLDAGTYGQMVEAAEACQVAIIHPGKPWNPDEPNLDQLIARAELFR